MGVLLQKCSQPQKVSTLAEQSQLVQRYTGFTLGPRKAAHNLVSSEQILSTYGYNPFEWAEPPMPMSSTGFVPFSIHINYYIATAGFSELTRLSLKCTANDRTQAICLGKKARACLAWGQWHTQNTNTELLLPPGVVQNNHLLLSGACNNSFCMGEQFFNAGNHHTTYVCMQVVLLQSLGFKCFT